MSQSRREVLQMLAAGQITAEEAERLIAALEREPVANPGTAEPARPKLKYLRVVVEELGGEGGEGDGRRKKGAAHVNVRVPMQLLRAGVKLAGLIPPSAQEKVNEALREKGIAFDLSQLKPENLEELIEALNELTVDVTDNNAKVAVFCE